MLACVFPQRPQKVIRVPSEYLDALKTCIKGICEPRERTLRAPQCCHIHIPYSLPNVWYHYCKYTLQVLEHVRFSSRLFSLGCAGSWASCSTGRTTVSHFKIHGVLPQLLTQTGPDERNCEFCFTYSLSEGTEQLQVDMQFALCLTVFKNCWCCIENTQNYRFKQESSQRLSYSSSI
uniref:Uncharacterized protein n=1 Tax=Rhipicephalus zambeziensis TaxID=60191 RepID=A0A224YC77_9ACAR